jgi:hypothetical protein
MGVIFRLTPRSISTIDPRDTTRKSNRLSFYGRRFSPAVHAADRKKQNPSVSMMPHAKRPKPGGTLASLVTSRLPANRSAPALRAKSRSRPLCALPVVVLPSRVKACDIEVLPDDDVAEEGARVVADEYGVRVAARGLGSERSAGRRREERCSREVLFCGLRRRNKNEEVTSGTVTERRIRSVYAGRRRTCRVLA